MFFSARAVALDTHRTADAGARAAGEARAELEAALAAAARGLAAVGGQDAAMKAAIAEARDWCRTPAPRLSSARLWHAVMPAQHPR